MIDVLEKNPYKDNTIVVFLTDHGFHLGEKHNWQWATLCESVTGLWVERGSTSEGRIVGLW
ncbi:hypothetical protein [Novipirellula herctigrandis]|uniref:hypothetical protein n=1 Tax=Novipirellula herctigrandis TaxID=2527986 RepID=UPI003AF3E0ED